MPSPDVSDGFRSHSGRPATPDIAPGRLVEVDGVTHHVLVQGTAGPVVVLESGLGGGVLEWEAVAFGLADTCTVVRHDRPGLGWSASSDPPSGGPRAIPPRTTLSAAETLRRLLQHLGLEGPYVLVGHSLGGLHVRAFAYLYPEDVAAVVLVDPSHEDAFRRIPGLRSLTRLQVMLFRAMLSSGPVGRWLLRTLHRRALESDCAKPRAPGTADVLDRAGALARRPTVLQTIGAELEGLETSYAQIRALGERSSFPPVPLRVISQGRRPSFGPMASMLSQWQSLHAELCNLSSDSKHLIAERSGHLIPLEQPEIIVAAIEGVIGR